MNERITQSEFIKVYCKKSNITEKFLNKNRQVALPCNCDSSDCLGWAMVSESSAIDHLNLNLKINYDK